MTHAEKIAAVAALLLLLAMVVAWLFDRYVLVVSWWPLVGRQWRAERRQRPEYCASCGASDCPGSAAVDYCPLWQEAEARNARGEWLTTTPADWDDEPSTDDDADAMIAAWHGDGDYHPAGSCDACVDPPDLSLYHEDSEHLAAVHPIYLDLSDDPDLIVWDAKQQADRCWEIVHVEFPRLRAELAGMWEAAA